LRTLVQVHEERGQHGSDTGMVTRLPKCVQILMKCVDTPDRCRRGCQSHLSFSRRQSWHLGLHLLRKI